MCSIDARWMVSWMVSIGESPNAGNLPKVSIRVFNENSFTQFGSC